ncbi:uncharacterized protein LMH87_009164 [Akanthomyces muscarius]|uniref:L-ornithine N(5)-monooxygenase n=1 Tax=Akanthomyces muscarius TaxID=2231603 RepID=A0A9W8UQD2_AKAMU|nr:uncharacterized protein LMH87_009164 [Akanthomyces muscarius]KAJ4158648.1 hypothetical protein LMH87_009164 [Akanthomyces muscarius]
MATNIPSVHETYAYEAQKRLRTDGLLQFQDVQQSASARIRHLAHDAWADEECLSATEPASTLFSTDQIRLVEAAGAVGGWNRFPGLHCDVESYVYMPLLEEMDYMPSQKYASGVEIRQYLQKVVEKYQLHHRIILGTKVDSLRWEEQDCVWKAELSSSHDPVLTRYEPPVNAWAAEAEFVILAAGYLARPQVPTLDGAGVDSFQGDMFHTARWDYGVTGGSSEDVFPQLEKLRDKKVVIIGTGATAIQVIRCLVKHAKEVFVFQRTPSAVYSRGQQGTDTKEWRDKIASAEGWHRDRMENMTARMSRSASSGLADLVNDEWTKLEAYAAMLGDPEWATITPDQTPDLVGHYLELDAKHSARLRTRVAEVVKDEATSQALTPWYPVWCKRPTFSDTYLQAFNEAHVHPIDTAGQGVDKITAGSVVVQDTEYRVDVLILATGYVSPTASRGDPGVRTGVQVVGRQGQTIGEKWETGHGMATLHGIATSGFPNLFRLGASQGPTSVNLTHVLDTQSQNIAYILARAHERARLPTKQRIGIVVEVEPEAEEAWSLRILDGAARWAILSTCTPSYLNNEGLGLLMAHGLAESPSQEDMVRTARTAPWSAGMPAFLQELAHWRREDSLCGYRVDVVSCEQ